MVEKSFRQGDVHSYHVPISRHKVYQNTIKHGRKMGGLETPKAKGGATEILTQIDGTMVPIVQAGSGKDRRKGKSTAWVEVRLCSALRPGEAVPIYGPRRADCQGIRWIWEAIMKPLGWTTETKVYGLGGQRTGWVIAPPEIASECQYAKEGRCH